MERLEAPTPGVLPDSPLLRVLLCPEDFARLPPVQKAGWQSGPTREKRPGHLG
jgi:hypothetical protein